MTVIQHNLNNKQRRGRRVHAGVQATSERPKLVVTRTNKAIYLQVVDVKGQVALSASDVAMGKKGLIKKGLTKTEKAAEVGKALAQDLKKAKIKALAVDRGANKFHGRIKAAVEAVRVAGVEA